MIYVEAVHHQERDVRWSGWLFKNACVTLFGRQILKARFSRVAENTSRIEKSCEVMSRVASIM